MSNGDLDVGAKIPTGLLDFLGTWRMARRIEDALSGEVSSLNGTAQFSGNGSLLDYREEGLLDIGDGGQLTATQRHVWRAGHGGQVEIAFSDGRPFHHFPLGKVFAEAEHQCPPDTYLATYDFSGWPNWAVAWRVSGPRKSYRMLTNYTPGTL